MPKQVFPFVIILLLTSCTSNSNKKDANQPIIKKTISSTIDSSNQQVILDDSECVFDTSSYRFTIDILNAYQANLPFIWNDTNKEAIISFNNNDTLRLHIGGCTHFSYSAIYTTSSTFFENDSLLIAKAKWLAKTFFRNGFDERYVNYINNNWYTLDKSIANEKSLILLDKDTSITDHIYEPIVFEKIKGRTKISVLGYQN